VRVFTFFQAKKGAVEPPTLLSLFPLSHHHPDELYPYNVLTAVLAVVLIPKHDSNTKAFRPQIKPQKMAKKIKLTIKTK
jgi:hypothetical protein